MARKLVELLIDEEQEEFGIQAISLVKFPAFEEDANFVFFGKDNKLTFAKLDEDKQLLIGCALIPEKRIPRYDQEAGEEYDVYFTKETIKKASELFLKYNKQNEHTLEHQKEITGLSVVESWIVDDPDNDKSKLYGFNLPVGSWMVSIKVDNNEVWKEVKAKSIKGLSIEGFFIDKIENMQKELSCEQLATKMDPVVFGKIKNLILENELMPVAVLDGEPLFETKEEAEMYATLFKGCRGFHPHNINNEKLFMACENHADAVEDNFKTIEQEDEFGKKKKKKKKKKYQKKNKYAEQIIFARRKALAKYPWDQCIRDQKKRYGSDEAAKKICGWIKAKYGS